MNTDQTRIKRSEPHLAKACPFLQRIFTRKLREGFCIMKRSTRLEVARQTVEISDRGCYNLTDGRVVDITPSVQACLDSTRFFPPEELKKLRQEVLCRPSLDIKTVIEV